MKNKEKPTIDAVIKDELDILMDRLDDIKKENIRDIYFDYEYEVERIDRIYNKLINNDFPPLKIRTYKNKIRKIIKGIITTLQDTIYDLESLDIHILNQEKINE